MTQASGLCLNGSEITFVSSRIIQSPLAQPVHLFNYRKLLVGQFGLVANLRQ
jgi:hypothetical protein